MSRMTDRLIERQTNKIVFLLQVWRGEEKRTHLDLYPYTYKHIVYRYVQEPTFVRVTHNKLRGHEHRTG